MDTKGLKKCYKTISLITIPEKIKYLNKKLK